MTMAVHKQETLAPLARDLCLLILVILLTSVLLAGRVAAQAGDPTTPAPSGAGTASTEPSVLEEIVVTARRVAENLQAVPISITALSQDDVERKGIQTAVDLQNFVPSLNVMSNTNPDQEFFTIRGIGATGFATGGGAGGGLGVVAYFAEVPSTASGPGLFYDLQSLEVLRGPQGTLFGENTTGGAILLVPNAPSDQHDGYAQVTLGDFDHKEFEGAGNLTLIPGVLYVRAAAQFNYQEGFVTDVVTGRDYQNRNSRAGRVTLRFTPTDTVQNDLIVNVLNYNENGPGNILIGVNPASPNGVALGPYLAAQDARGPRRTSLSFPGVDKSESYAGIDNFRWQISPETAFKNIVSYSVYKINLGFDADASPLIIEDLTGADPGGWQTQTATWTEEPQFQGNLFDNALVWQAGAFFDRAKNPGLQTYNINLGALYLHQNQLDQRTHSDAGYGQATYDLSRLSSSLQGFKLTAGYRYTWDYVFEAQSAYIPTFGNFCITGTGPFFPNCLQSGSSNSSGPSWTLDLDDQISQNTLLYLASRHGYQSGGFNLNVNQQTSPFYSYKPESDTDVELGLKWETHASSGVAARVNADIFRTFYRDIQRNVFAQLPNVPQPTQVTNNAARATIQGFEFEGTFVPTPSVELSATYSYLDAYYNKYITPIGQDLTNLPFEFTPRNKVSLGLRYFLPLPGTVGRVSAQATYSYQSAVNAVPDIEPFGVIGGYSLLNLRLGWDNVAGTQLDLALFVDNVNDTLYRVNSVGAYNSLAAATTTYGPPRMFGGSLRYRF